MPTTRYDKNGKVIPPDPRYLPDPNRPIQRAPRGVRNVKPSEVTRAINAVFRKRAAAAQA